MKCIAFWILVSALIVLPFAAEASESSRCRCYQRTGRRVVVHSHWRKVSVSPKAAAVIVVPSTDAPPSPKG